MARVKKTQSKTKNCRSGKKNGTKSSDRRVSSRKTNRMSKSEDSESQMITDSKGEKAVEKSVGRRRKVTNTTKESSSTDKKPVGRSKKRKNRSNSSSLKNRTEESSVDRSEEDHNGESSQRKESNKDESSSVKTSEDEANYVVEDIIDFKIKDDKLYFLIRWEGYDASADSWGEQTSLNCPELIDKFYEKHPDSRITINHWKRKYDSDYEVSSSDSNCDLSTIKKSCSSRRNGKNSVKTREYTSSDEETESETDIDEVNAAPKVRNPVGRPRNNTATKNSSSTVKRTVGRPRTRHDEIEDEEYYEVEDIIGFGFEDNIKYFLIRWKGYDSSADSWERQRSMNCPELIAKFYEKHPEAQVSTRNYKKSKKQHTNSDCSRDNDYDPSSDELHALKHSGFFKKRGKKSNNQRTSDRSTKFTSAYKTVANNTSDEDSQGGTEESEPESEHNSSTKDSQPEIKKKKSIGRGRPKKRLEANVSSSTKKLLAGRPKKYRETKSSQEEQGDHSYSRTINSKENYILS